MKNLQKKLFAFLLFALTCPHFASSQNSLTNELSFEVNRIYPPISITKEKLQKAHTLPNLNPNYPSSWIREYISVEILTIYKGRVRKAVGKTDTLSQEQKDQMNEADLGTDIEVKVHYMPENTLSHNDAKEIRFTFTVEPESEAKYVGGQQQLTQYLKNKAIDKIPKYTFKGYDLAAIKFTIDEIGQIGNVHVFETSKNEKIDALLVKAICNMPNWKPAEYVNGLKVQQEFVLTVGNMENCVTNLLNIRPVGVAK